MTASAPPPPSTSSQPGLALVRRARGTFRDWGHELALFALLCALLTISAVLMPKFVQLDRQLVLSRHLWETAILAIGMTLIVIAGGIDLSVGSLMGLCAVMFGICHATTQQAWLSAVCCVTVGVLGGMLNGILVAAWRIHPLIVTLATYAAFRGMAEGLSQGTSYTHFGEIFRAVARDRWLGLPIAGWLFLALTIVYGIWLAVHPTGRFLYALGHNERGARYAGIPVDRIRFWLHTNLGAWVGLTTLIYVGRFDTAKADAGLTMELDVITAVVIGGTSIRGGRGNLVGTALGLLLIHEVRNFVGTYWRMEELKSILVGGLLIGTILVRHAIALRTAPSDPNEPPLVSGDTA